MSNPHNLPGVACPRRKGPKPGSAKLNRHGKGNGGCAKEGEYSVKERTNDVVAVDQFDGMQIASAVGLNDNLRAL